MYDEDEQTFIVEVFSGCVRYAEILNVVMRGYYAKDGKAVLRSEQNLYAGMWSESIVTFSVIDIF